MYSLSTGIFNLPFPAQTRKQEEQEKPKTNTPPPSPPTLEKVCQTLSNLSTVSDAPFLLAPFTQL